MVLVLAQILLLANSLNNSSLSANFADSVLRPLIGNMKTIALESLFFNAEDKAKLVVYKFASPKEQIFSQNSSKTEAAVSPDMDLISIPVNSKLDPLEGEGVWQPIDSSLFPQTTVLARSLIRPDNERPYAIVALVKINMKLLRLGAVAGISEPGGSVGHRGPGLIPIDIQKAGSLIAAFNGGFQQKDGAYGMIVGNQVYLPLKWGLATLVIDKDSNLKIVDYEGQNLGNGNLVMRQNGAMLVQDSKIIPEIADNQYKLWGRTVTNSMYTWRSGIGITKDGNLIYAVGPSLVPETLASALLSAGAVNAMQLDINPYWVRFVIFNSLSAGKYKHYSLLKDMYDGGENFLHGYQKDFFYLFKR